MFLELFWAFRVMTVAEKYTQNYHVSRVNVCRNAKLWRTYGASPTSHLCLRMDGRQRVRLVTCVLVLECNPWCTWLVAVGENRTCAVVLQDVEVHPEPNSASHWVSQWEPSSTVLITQVSLNYYSAMLLPLVK